MALNFPNAPATGDKFPVTPVGGQPQYVWDSEKWTTIGAPFPTKTPIWSDGSVSMKAQLTLLPTPVAATDAASKGYVDAKPSGGATQAYVDAGDALRVLKAGDTMTGQLTLPTGPAAANAVRKDYVDAGDTASTAVANGKVDKGGDTMTGHLTLPTGPAAANAVRKDYVDTAVASGVSKTYVDTQDATKVNKSGDTMTGGLTVNGELVAATNYLRFIVSGGPGYIQFNGAGNYGLGGGGNIWHSGNFNPGNYVAKSGDTMNGTLAVTNGRIVSQVSNNPSFCLYATSWGAAGFWAGGNLYVGATDGSGTPTAGWVTINNSIFQIVTDNAQKPSGGTWAANSDERIKTVLGDYTQGLEAVAALQPVRYSYKGNDTPIPPSNAGFGVTPDEDMLKEDQRNAPTAPYKNSLHYSVAGKEFIGLIAQAAEVPMPEMVTKTDGFIDGAAVTDLRSLDTTPLIFALVNAVKELKARIEVLETAT